MDQFEATKTIEFYENLEEELLAFLKVLPYDDQNIAGWSPKLFEIVVGAGSLLDSLFRMSMPEGHNGKKRGDYNINDFSEVFGNDLEPLRSFVYLSPPILLHPFKGWSSSKPPYWWNHYNSIEHDRIKNMRLATIQTAMDILCGLFEAIAQNQKMSKALLRHSWTNLSINPDLIIPKLETMKLPEATGDMGGGNTFFVQSKLFATTLGSEILPDDISKIQPMSYVGAKRLVIYLGKWMG